MRRSTLGRTWTIVSALHIWTSLVFLLSCICVSTIYWQKYARISLLLTLAVGHSNCGHKYGINYYLEYFSFILFLLALFTELCVGKKTWLYFGHTLTSQVTISNRNKWSINQTLFTYIQYIVCLFHTDFFRLCVFAVVIWNVDVVDLFGWRTKLCLCKRSINYNPNMEMEIKQTQQREKIPTSATGLRKYFIMKKKKDRKWNRNFVGFWSRKWNHLLTYEI